MAKSEPTHVVFITGWGQGIGHTNPDRRCVYAIADTAFAVMRHHERKLPTKSETPA